MRRIPGTIGCSVFEYSLIFSGLTKFGLLRFLDTFVCMLSGDGGDNSTGLLSGRVAAAELGALGLGLHLASSQLVEIITTRT